MMYNKIYEELEYQIIAVKLEESIQIDNNGIPIDKQKKEFDMRVNYKLTYSEYLIIGYEVVRKI